MSPSWGSLNNHDVWVETALHRQSLYKYKKMKTTSSASIGIHPLRTDDETEA